MYAWDEHNENYLSLSNIYSMFICLLFCFYHNIWLKATLFYLSESKDFEALQTMALLEITSKILNKNDNRIINRLHCRRKPAELQIRKPCTM